MSQWGLVKDQLLSQGTNHFVIVSDAWEVVACSGDFEIAEKQQLANSILRQCAALMLPDEELKRITMTFDDVVYIATTIVDNHGRYGVVVKRQLEAALA